MNFIGRAIRNVKRRLSKTILLTLTFFLIGNLVIIGLGINNAAKNAKIIARKQMRAIISYGVDFNEVQKKAETIEDEQERAKFYQKDYSINYDEIKDYLNDPRVKTIEASNNEMAYVAGKTKFVLPNEEYEKRIAERKEEAAKNPEMPYYRENEIVLKTNVVPSSIDVEDGKVRIVDGKFYTQEDIDNYNLVAVVSKKFAEINNLSVGSTFEILYKDPSSSSQYMKPVLGEEKIKSIKDDDFKVSLKVIGIFEHDYNKSSGKPDEQKYYSPIDLADNAIFVPPFSLTYATLNGVNKLIDLQVEYLKKTFAADGEKVDINDILSTPYYQKQTKDNFKQLFRFHEATILLKDPLEVDGFGKDIEKNKPEFRKIDLNNSEFNRFSKPLDSISLFSSFIVTLVVVNAIVIITLVVALTLKTREYEIGVLLSLGSSKIHVITQFFVELALVALLGFSLACISGTLTASKVGQEVLNRTVSYSKVDAENEEEKYNFGRVERDFNPYGGVTQTSVSLDDIVSHYKVSLSPLIIGFVYLIGMGIVLVSVVIPSFMIMRYNPKKILMNTN